MLVWSAVVLDSSCQINPEYARVVLSNFTAFSDKLVLKAVFDEARCLSITHEGNDVLGARSVDMNNAFLAACTSQKKCEWAEREAGEMRGAQSHCQYEVRILVLLLKPMHYTVFRVLRFSGRIVLLEVCKALLKIIWFAENVAEGPANVTRIANL